MQKIKLHMLEKYNYFENIFLQSWSLDDEGSHEKETAWFELPDGFEIAAGKDGIKRVYDLRNGESIPCRGLYRAAAAPRSAGLWKIRKPQSSVKSAKRLVLTGQNFPMRHLSRCGHWKIGKAVSVSRLFM